jgi:hypothetical protein
MRVNSNEFYLWLNGYLEALESEGIETCKISNIRKQMKEVVPVNPYPVAMPRQVMPRGPQVTQPTPPTKDPLAQKTEDKKVSKKSNKKFSETITNPLDSKSKSPVEKGYEQKVLEAEARQGLR